MPLEQFVERKFQDGSLALIEKANEIIEDYQARGFTLTLRQLYYQFVSRDLIPNKQSEYKRLGSVINDARLAGLIDWSAIEDRTRNVRTISTWDDPAQIVEAVAEQFGINAVTVRQIHSGKIWKQGATTRHIFSDDEIRRVRAYPAGVKGAAIALAEEFGVTISVIHRIRNREAYADAPEASEIPPASRGGAA